MAARAIAYLRVSTDEQAQSGLGLEAQEQRVRAYAGLYDLELVDVVVDAGVSAKTLERPGLKRALARLRRGEADALLVAKLDRLTRSVVDLGELLARAFGPDGAQLLSVAEQIDTRSAAGRLVLNVLVSVAQWEREAIGERTSAALAAKKARGEALGRAPFGWRYERGQLVEVLEEQVALELMREYRSAGKTFAAIAAVLAARGYKPRGKAWRASNVHGILSA